MIPQIIATGLRETYQLLHDVAGRMRDASPAWEGVADSIFGFEARWWQFTYGGGTDKDKRAGRNPAYMQETGGLRASATRRGAQRQVVDVGDTYVFVGVTHGLADIHEGHGRQVLGEPSRREAQNWIEQVGDYIMTGRHG